VIKNIENKNGNMKGENINIKNDNSININERINKMSGSSRNTMNNKITQNSNQNENKNNLNNNNNSKNNQNESKNKTIDKEIEEKYKNELEKLRKDVPDLANYFSDNMILTVLSKNNGDINKVQEYLFDYLVESQKKNK
jgi:hypothetical protein